ncbi:Copper chaperone CopZ [Catalinimonas alkaloidigena]|uniref:Copper chaperone CopZ n=1 Tax=Catalinimonas alkaloidigena TaxID=1075417 RepID=A0A1G9VMV0_9BACT|nr:heavy-metal-associated domain-containing protein [Catalinimonas alkaloidigena]SDM73437.1 Copper chaperone CopZ [Catalinimonas alkaloidigena]
MKTTQFKTNIKCGGCIATVTPHLTATPGVDSWQVDTQHPEKLLTVQGEFSNEEVKQRVKAAGFTIEEK